MRTIEIHRVTSKKDMREFALFPWRIYHNDPLWVAPILKERLKTINPATGSFFNHGTAEFFTARRDGKPIGTICTAIDHKANQTVNKKECVFGFWECIPDHDAANLLFDHAVAWARAQDLSSLYGPFNLDYEDGYGVLLEGREYPAAILCGHTPDYYRAFIESYGFKPARGQNLAFRRDLTSNRSGLDEVIAFGEKVKAKRKFTIRSADISHWKEEVNRVYELINPCLQHLPGFEPWQPECLQDLMAPFVELADPNLILFAEDQGHPIGFFPALPNFNEILIHLNGLRYPWDYLKAMWYGRKKPKGASIKSVLVLPEYWGSGVAILLFSEMVQRLITAGYEWVDLSLTSDDNPRTPALAERAGAQVYKRYQVYRLEI